MFIPDVPWSGWGNIFTEIKEINLRSYDEEKNTPLLTLTLITRKSGYEHFLAHIPLLL